MSKPVFLIAIIIYFIFTASATHASALFFLPQDANYEKESVFIETLYIDTGENKINTIEGKVLFDYETLEIIDIVTGGSIVKFWINEPAASNEKGAIGFSGGIPNGYKGAGTIFKIIFKAKKTGTCDLNFSEIKILLNDGQATEDKINFTDNSCTIVEKRSETTENEKQSEVAEVDVKNRPDQNEWQSDNNIALHWDVAEEAEYSYILSKDSMADPDKIADKPEGKLIWMGDMSYEGLEDGIYYFHLKQKLSDKSWSEKRTDMILIDNTPPEEFIPQVVEIAEKRYLVFNTTDATSGIDYYEVFEQDLSGTLNESERETGWKKAKSPYLLKSKYKKNLITVKAIDKAGNERLAEILSISRFADKSKPLYDQIALLMLSIIILTAAIIIVSIVLKIFRSVVKQQNKHIVKKRNKK